MANQLAASNSPYLIQHAENPVDWYPWSQEALQRARKEDKPIFLSIGYAACHWCHVMAHESFEDPHIAAIMNADFINIKVDREERPDIDHIYMQAVVAMTGNGGWPMSVFLTPEGKPFFGGTYFPPQRKFNLPSFEEILTSIAGLWQKDRVKLLESSQNIIGHIQRNQFFPTSNRQLDASLLEQASLKLAQGYDWKHGGWGNAPKFPQPMAIEFLLRRSIDGDRMALEIASHALTAMAQGGMYDILAGGFARYSTDERWLVPHFEKMLYDNAQLARAYLHAYLVTGETSFRKTCEETLDFTLRELSTHRASDEFTQVGFFSSLDADSEGVEGKYYVWSYKEVQQALQTSELVDSLGKDVDPFTLFQAAFTFSQQGNFEGSNILQMKSSIQSLADEFHLEADQIQDCLSKINRQLLRIRESRIRPGLDDKALTSWNALALLAFAEAGRYLDREDYLAVARASANFLVGEMWKSGELERSWRQGQAQHNAFLEDYAGLILGLIALYQSDANLGWYLKAIRLCDEMLDHFSDPEGGFYDTRDDHEALIMRPKDIHDNATPSGNALAACALLTLAAYSGNTSWRTMAENMLKAIQEIAAQYPTSFSQWLCALDDAVHPTQEIALLASSPDGERPFLNKLWNAYRPHTFVARSAFPPDSESPALLRDKIMIEDMPTAYVCENFTCNLPVTSPMEFERQLYGSIQP